MPINTTPSEIHISSSPQNPRDQIRREPDVSGPRRTVSALPGPTGVQRSRDPYADFRASMVEMVVSRQMFGAVELERLLRSYLSLNAPRHHPVILQAFSDIWVILHGG